MGDRRASLENVPWDTAVRVDDACDRFEAQFRSGSGPQIEVYISDASEPERSVLFRELLMLEMQLTSKVASDAMIVLNDYRSRFPAFRAIVEEIVTEVIAPLIKTANVNRNLGDAAGNPQKPSDKPGATPFSEDELSLPFQLGVYRLESKLGRGGMGTVYRAVHQALHRPVALKLMQREHMQRWGAVVRFQREMRAVAKLKHPNIVMAYDAGEVNGLHFLAMEQLSGWDLASIVRCFGTLPIPVACECIRQAALGLQHVHEHGLVHRDIKPSNLMLTEDGEVKLLDLGLARLREDELDERLTLDSAPMGTIEYMAPEQALNPHGVDIRADLYSLGCTLFKLLCGFSPFAKSAGNMMQFLSAHKDTSPPALRDCRDDVPLELEDLVNRLLRKNPADRPLTPKEVVAALEPFASGQILKSFASSVRQICDAGGKLPRQPPKGIETQTCEWQSEAKDATDVTLIPGDDVDARPERMVPTSDEESRRLRFVSRRRWFAGIVVAIAGIGMCLPYLPTRRAVNQLDRIDPVKDVLVGAWTRQRGAWMSPANGPGCLRLARAESGDYLLEVTIKLGKGSSRWTIVSTARPKFAVAFQPEFMLPNENAGSKSADKTVGPNWRGNWGDYSDPSPRRIRVTVRDQRLTLERDGDGIGHFDIPSEGQLNWPIPQAAYDNPGLYLLTEESQVFVTHSQWDTLKTAR